MRFQHFGIIIISICLLVGIVSAYNFTHIPNAFTTSIDDGNSEIVTIKISPDDNYLFVSNWTACTIFKRNGDTYTDLGNPDIGNLSGQVMSAAWSPDSTYLLIGKFGEYNLSFIKRSGDTFTKLSNITVTDPFYPEYAYGITWSPDGSHVVIGLRGGNGIAVFKKTGDTLSELPDDGGVSGSPNYDVYGPIAYSPDGNHLAIADWGEWVTIYKRSGDTYTLLTTVNDTIWAPDYSYNSVDYAKNGDKTFLITAVYGGAYPHIFVFEVNGDTYTEISQVSEGDDAYSDFNYYRFPERNMQSVRASPDGKLLAFGSDDVSQGFIYHLSKTGKILPISQPYINEDYIWDTRYDGYAFNSENNRLIIGGGNFPGHYNGLNLFEYHSPPETNFTYYSPALEASFIDTSTSDPPIGWAWFFGDESYDQSWVMQNASAGWTIRYESSGVTLPDGSIVVMGGNDYDYGDRNDTWISKDKGVTWQLQNNSSGWDERSRLMAASLPDGNIIVMGGTDNYERRNDTWRSIDQGITWQLMNASSGWSARVYSGSTALPDGSVVVVGGEDYNWKNDTWRSIDEGYTWQLMNSSSGWSERVEPAIVSLSNGDLVLMGGYDNENGELNDTWRSTDNGVTWQLMNASSGWMKRDYPRAVSMPDDSILLIGGYASASPHPHHINDTWRSTDEGATWVQLPDAGWIARDEPIIISLPDGSIEIMGGAAADYYNDVWRFDPVGSHLQNPSHTYSGAGMYNVSLQAYTLGGFDIKQEQITVPSELLEANFINESIDLSVNFTDTSTGSPTGWAWFFGDEAYDESWVEQNASSGWGHRIVTSTVALPDGSIVLMGGYDSDGDLGGLFNDTWRSTDKGITWQLQNASGGWILRGGHNSVVLSNGNIILMGGYGSIRYNDTWRSTDKGATWQLMNASGGWNRRDSFTSVALPDDSIILMGGYDGSNVKNDTWRSTDEGATWQVMNVSSGWIARSDQASVALPDGSIVLMGGWGGGYKNDTWISTDQGVTWQLQNASGGWIAREYFTSVALPDGSIVLMGGYKSSSPHYMNDTWRSTDQGITWNQLPTANWEARYENNGVVLPDGSIIIIGGDGDNGYVNDTWRMQPVGSSLQNPSHTYVSDGMYNVTLQVYNAFTFNKTQKQITVPSGPQLEANFTYTAPTLEASFTDTSTGSPTGWAWFFGDENYTQSWTLQNESSGWFGRAISSSTAIPSGGIILTGGQKYSPSVIYNDTWGSIDQGVTWQLMNTSSGWEERAGHTIVALSNGNIILMGGHNPNLEIYYNDTWRSVDNGITWQLMNASSGWTSRFYHSAVVLSDDSIIIMGGDNEGYGESLNDTWRSTDEGISWVLMNTSSGWEAREDHTSVALSDNSIVLMGGWGYNPSTLHNDTWRSIDQGASWVLMNASSGWTARDFPSSVVMPDNSIILAGGYNNDKWRSTDGGFTWVQLPNTDWYSAGNNLVTVSDGSIIVIGTYGPGYKNDTWRFDPAGSHLQNPSHTYASDGMYNVTLQVYNAFTFNKTQKQITVPSESPLVANFTNTSIELTALFNDTSTGSPTGWAWFFGDEPYNQSWVEQNASGGWTARYCHNTVVLPNNNIILFGGTTGSDFLNDTWRSTDKGVTWTNITNNPSLKGRYCPSSVVLSDGSIVLMGGGGDGDGLVYYNDTWRSTDEGITWVQQNASGGWTERADPDSVVLPDDSIVLIGGYGGVSGLATNDTWRSTDKGITWQLQNASSGLAAQYGFTSLVTKEGNILLIGGNTPLTNDYNNITWRSTDKGVTWSNITGTPGWSGRQNFGGFSMPDGSIIITGGYSYTDTSNLFNDTWRSTDQGITWVQLPNATWSIRNDITGVVLNDGSILISGGSYTGGKINQTWRMQPVGSSDQNPSHTYASDGMYNVTLQVYNAFTFNKTTKSLNVSESVSNESTFTPFANFTATSPTGYYIGNVLTGYMPFTVTFTDTSVNGTPTNWSWSFGDGVYSEQQNPVHIYTINNTYRVTLVASNIYGSSSYSRNITVTPILPLASFTVSPNVGTVPLTVSFTDTSLGVSIINWSWNFGDGGTSYLQNPVHTYLANGTYYTQLSVITSTGDYNISQSIPVYAVVDPVPMVDFIGSPLYGKSPLVVQFTDKSTSLNGLIGWNWSFGDGDYTNSTAQNPLHVYQNPGQYSVTLVVLGQNNHFLSVPHGTTSEQIVNGGFETGDFTGWNGVGSDITDFDPYSGSYTSYINWNTGIINQNNINFTGVHILTFWTNNSVDLLDILTVNISGTTVFSENISGSWQEHLVDVSSFSGNHSLTFTQTGSSFLFIDNVSALSINTSYTTSTPLTNYTSKHGYINVEVPSGSVNADYTATPTIGDYPLTVQFTDISVCNPACTSWNWDLDGDGSTDSNVKNPIFTYNYPLIYSPKLIASNGINSGTMIHLHYINVGPTYIPTPIPQPTTSWVPGYRDEQTGLIVSFQGDSTIDLNNGTYLKYWLQNFTSTGDFNVYGFVVSIMAPLLHVFGFWIFLIIWGLYLFAVWIRAQDVTLPLIIGIISMGTFGLLFPKEALPVIIIMFVICGAIIITKLMKDSI